MKKYGMNHKVKTTFYEIDESFSGILYEVK